MKKAARTKLIISFFPPPCFPYSRWIPLQPLPPNASYPLSQALEINTPGGKLNRGLSVVDTVQILKGGAKLSDEEYFKAGLLGWCIELVGLQVLVYGF